MNHSSKRHGREGQRLVRTSATHPLWISEVAAGDAGGCIGITFCPGKHGPSLGGFHWQRELQADLDVVARWKPDAVLTLIEDHEFAMLHVVGLGEAVRTRGLAWHHMPISDLRPPDTRFEAAWALHGPGLLDMLRDGGRVLVHCRGGLGRAGTVAARMLVDLGVGGQEAVRSVRAARPGAIETDAQRQYVLHAAAAQAASHAPPEVRPNPAADWFERLTGFREQGYAATRAQLRVEGSELVSRANGRRHGIGHLELVSLQELRERAAQDGGLPGRLRCRIDQGNVRAMHRAPEFAGALFQVASQFNLLEMVSPTVSPEDGVTRYQDDPTQGPACAIAAGAATVYRNYFAPVGEQSGQTARCQLDALANVGAALAAALDRPAAELWTMRNGYALCSRSGLDAITAHLQSADSRAAQSLGALLRIGLHWDVEVTDAPGPARPRVSQAFCSALPVAYSSVARRHWSVFAEMVLRAAYEATLWAAVVNARRGGSRTVLLTRLGGGAFGNDEAWIQGAMRHALRVVSHCDLDVRLVSYGAPSWDLRQLEAEFA